MYSLGFTCTQEKHFYSLSRQEIGRIYSYGMDGAGFRLKPAEMTSRILQNWCVRQYLLLPNQESGEFESYCSKFKLQDYTTCGSLKNAPTLTPAYCQRYPYSNPWLPVDVTLCGNRVSVDVIQLRILRQGYPRLSGWALKAFTGIFMKGRQREI